MARMEIVSDDLKKVNDRIARLQHAMEGDLDVETRQQAQRELNDAIAVKNRLETLLQAFNENIDDKLR